MLANLTVALPEDLATRAEKYASAHGMTLEELLLSLCKQACDAQKETKNV